MSHFFCQQSHLMEVYKILKIWGTDDALARCGLMHSEQQHTSAAHVNSSSGGMPQQCGAAVPAPHRCSNWQAQQ
jgi:hypothetical protein